MTNVKLSIQNVDKFYGSEKQGVHAVKNLSMDVQHGEIVALLGSSGCGKTSTLRMIAGFEEVSKGRVLINDREINRLQPAKRNVAMAFEGYSLYPPLSVRDNIAFALKSTKLSTNEVYDKVDEIAKMLDITNILDRYPSSISGGQQQRASLGRALIRDADLHLLDEPMGQLEPQLRAILRGRIKHYIKSNDLTAILVTHDQAEANALADRIAVMEDGRLEQFDTPLAIKEQPSNLFSGTFIGEPPMNVFHASVRIAEQSVSFDLSDSSVVLSYPIAEFSSGVVDVLQSQQEVVLGVRPYAVKRSVNGESATVVVNQWLGDQSHIAADFAGRSIILVEHDRATDKPGDSLSLSIDPSNLHIFDRKTGNAISHGKLLT